MYAIISRGIYILMRLKKTTTINVYTNNINLFIYIWMCVCQPQIGAKTCHVYLSGSGLFHSA